MGSACFSVRLAPSCVENPSVDRHAPSIRPPGSNAGTQRWGELLFLHWSVPVDAMRAVVPSELELDLYDERAWVGVVPFLMRDIAPSWWPSALAFNFLECNLRTYVHYKGQPGVFFFSLEASSWLAVQAARTGWGLPYHHAVMSASAGTFETVRNAGGAHLRVDYTIGSELGASPLGSREHFFLERYYLFAIKRGRLVRGQVHHVPYPAFDAQVTRCEESLIAAAGLPGPNTEPELIHYSPGVEVEVFAPELV